MRLVFDTDTMVAAIRSDLGASRRLLTAALERRFSLLVSVPLMIEYEAVMARAEHLKAAGLHAGEVGELLDLIADVAIPVRLAYLWRPAAHDPADDMVLETAINGQADAIVTFNLRDLKKAAGRFGIEAVPPREIALHLE